MVIDELGFLNINNFPGKIYTFAHYLDEPIFTHFISSDPISNSKISDNEISFSKNFISNNKLPSCHNITQEQNCINWTFNITNKNNLELCYGISIPISSAEVWLPSGILANDIINYSENWIPPYPNQSNCDIPIVKVKIGENYFAILSDFTYPCHFFKYNDNGQYYIKIGIKSYDSSESIFKIKQINQDDDLKAIYKEQFPLSSAIIEFWEIIFGKLSKLYEINVFFDVRLSKWHFKCSITSKSNVINYSPLLFEEFSKYPANLLRNINIRHMYLVENLIVSDRYCNAVICNDHLIIDIGNNIPEYFKRVTLHHEIYHCLENKIKKENSVLFDEFVTQLQSIKDDQFSILKSFQQYWQPTNHEEIRAELFASIMMGNDNKTIAEEIMRNFIHKSFPEINLKPIKVLKYYSLSKKEVITEKQDKKNNLLIVGMAGAGLNLTKNLLLNYYDNISTSNCITEKNGNILFVVRNPVELVAMRSQEPDFNLNLIVNQISELYSLIINNRFPYLRYEDLIAGKALSTQKMLSNIGIDNFNFNINLIDEKKCKKYDTPLRKEILRILNSRLELSCFNYHNI